MTRQRRRYERFETDLRCRIYVVGGRGERKFEASARLKDLSLGGAFIASGFHFKKVDEPVVVELPLARGTLSIPGRIVRQPDGGLGVAFAPLAPREREILLSTCVPARHRRFFEESVAPSLKNISLDRVSLILHLWQEWEHEEQQRHAEGETPASPSKKDAGPPERVTRRA